MAITAARNVFERWTPVWHAFFYVMLALATTIVLLHFRETGGPRAVVVALVGVLVVLHVLLMVRPGRGHRERPRLVGIYLAGAIPVSAYLVHIDTAFLMVAMTLYNHVFAFLVMRWALPAAAALTVAIGLVVTRTADATTSLVTILGAGAALVFSLFLRATSEESEKRRSLIEELRRTHEQLAFAERLAGRTEERSRIARELHDTVTQQLIGIVMHLEAASATEPDRARAALEGSLRLAREGLAEARRLVWAERPAQLEGGSLTRALQDATSRASQEVGLEAELSIPDEIDTLPAAVQTLVLRAVQESLANVRKHASARRVMVTASASDDLLTLDIHDDGVGFDPSTAEVRRTGGAGFGLRAIRERVQAMGGSLSIESERGVGTTTAIHVPLKREALP